MAANIFIQKDYMDIKDRINQLKTQSQRQWGEMSLNQTLEHCSIQLRIGLGILPITGYEGPSMFRTTIGHWMLLYALPWPKGSETPSQMNVLSKGSPLPDIQDSKQALLELLEKVQAEHRFKPHPFFGNMGKKDWGRLIWKHLDHHLRQFGN